MRRVTENKPQPKENILSIRRSNLYWLERARRTRDPKREFDRVLFYRKALEEHSRPSVLLELAEVYCSMRCFDAADRCILKALRQDPTLGEGWYLLGRTSLARGDEETSQNAFDRCMRCAPASPSADKAQEMLAGYPWKPFRPIPRMGFRADCLFRRAEKASDPFDQLLLLLAAIRKSPSPKILLKLLSLCLSDSPAFVLHFLPFVLKDRGLFFEAMLLGAKARAMLGKNPLPCLQAARSRIRTVSQTQQFFRTGLDCRVPGWTRTALEALMKDAPWSAELYEMCAACADRMGQPEAARRFRSSLNRIDPDHDPHKNAGIPDQSASSLMEMAVYHNRLRTGRLNRLLHLMTFSLKDVCSVREVYRVLVPLYLRLSRRAKRSIESGQVRTWRRAFAVCVSIETGNLSEASMMLNGGGRKKAVLRKIRRIDRGLCRRANMLAGLVPAGSSGRKGRFIDEMHQF